MLETGTYVSLTYHRSSSAMGDIKIPTIPSNYVNYNEDKQEINIVYSCCLTYERVAVPCWKGSGYTLKNSQKKMQKCLKFKDKTSPNDSSEQVGKINAFTVQSLRFENSMQWHLDWYFSSEGSIWECSPRQSRNCRIQWRLLRRQAKASGRTVQQLLVFYLASLHNFPAMRSSSAVALIAKINFLACRKELLVPKTLSDLSHLCSWWQAAIFCESKTVLACETAQLNPFIRWPHTKE